MKKWLFLATIIAAFSTQTCRADDVNQSTNDTPNPPRATFADTRLDLAEPREIWTNGVGNGFLKGTHEVEVSLEKDFGIRYNRGQLHHELAIASVRYGVMLSGVVGESHWYRGNWEFLGQGFAGGQYAPRSAYVVGLTPMLRYSFATGTRWTPFLEGGAGPSITDIGGPDLSTTYEFNLQGNAGAHYFWNKNQAITAQVGYLHLSNAGLKQPNQGVNAIAFLIGASWFF